MKKERGIGEGRRKERGRGIERERERELIRYLYYPIQQKSCMSIGPIHLSIMTHQLPCITIIHAHTHTHTIAYTQHTSYRAPALKHEVALQTM